MIDFLKNNPYVTREEYMWKWTIPQIQLASFDFTHVEYLSEKQAKIEKQRKNTVRVDNPLAFANEFGIPIFDK